MFLANGDRFDYSLWTLGSKKQRVERESIHPQMNSINGYWAKIDMLRCGGWDFHTLLLVHLGLYKPNFKQQVLCLDMSI